MNDGQKGSLDFINTAMYSVAAVLTFREGNEFCSGNSTKFEKNEPKWKRRLNDQILTLRKEADIPEQEHKKR